MSDRRRGSRTRPRGATERHYASILPDSRALRGDPWSIGLAAIANTLHTMGVTHMRVMWWHPVIGTGERPPTFPVSWCIKVVDDDGRELCAGHSAVTEDHGIGVVEAGADCIRSLMERRAAA